jgi:hypothetical protein
MSRWKILLIPITCVMAVGALIWLRLASMTGSSPLPRTRDEVRGVRIDAIEANRIAPTLVNQGQTEVTPAGNRLPVRTETNSVVGGILNNWKAQPSQEVLNKLSADDRIALEMMYRNVSNTVNGMGVTVALGHVGNKDTVNLLKESLFQWTTAQYG